MNKSMAKTIALLLAVAVLSGLMWACSGQGTNGSDTGTGTSAPASNESAASPAETGTEEDAEPADPFGAFAEPVTISVGMATIPGDTTLPEGDTLEDNQYTRLFAELLNVHFKVIWAAANGEAYQQKVKLSISSNDIPDAMIVSREELELLVRAELIEDMTDVYDRYASPLIKRMHDSTGGASLATATFDGRLMALPDAGPVADGVRMVWLRQDWIDRLGLPEPKTLDDLEQVLQAFIGNDPDGNGRADTIGLVANNYSLLTDLLSAYRSYPGIWYRDESGKIVYGSVTPQTKQGLLKLQEMFKKGLIDPEFGLKDPKDALTTGRSGAVLMSWHAPNWLLGDSVALNPQAKWQNYLIPVDSDGNYSTKMNPVSSRYIVVKKGFAHPDAIMKIVNAMNEADFGTRLNLQVSPAYNPLRLLVLPTVVADYYINTTKAINGEIDPDDLPPTEKDVYEKYMRVIENPDVIHLEDWQWSTAVLVGGAKTVEPMTQIFPVYSAQTATMRLKWPALLKMEEEVYNKIIRGTLDIDAFDQFVSDWKAQGGDEITKEVEEAVGPG